MFSEAETYWELLRLYVDINLARQNQNNQPPLTPLEKTCLRGLLCGYSPEQIASHLNGESYGLIINLTWRIHRCIQIMTGRTPKEVESYRDIPEWLEAAGYKICQSRQDWENAPDVSIFYGRSSEQQTLKQWIVQERCRLVAIVGMVGIGKTVLTSKVAKEIQREFDFVIWRSMGCCLSFQQLLAELIQFFSAVRATNLAQDTYSSISQLIKYLRTARCLVVLDDWQLVMEKPEEYQAYQLLLKTIAEVPHQSCLVINSSEKPAEIALLSGDLVRCLPLSGLGKSAREILKAKGLSDEHLWEKIITLYRGNPRKLKLVATTIKDVFAGSVIEFFDQETYLEVIVDDVSKNLLDRQFQRLSEFEQQIMKILARHTQPITREQLQQELQVEVYTSEITKALESLLRRSLVEIIRHNGQQLFTLEPIVMKYVIREYLSSEQNTNLVKFIPSQSNLPLQPQPLPQFEYPQPSLAIVNSQQPSNLVRARPNILPVVQENDFLPPISLWTQLGGLFLAGAVGIAIALAAVTPYKVTVQAQANIRPAGELRLVEAETEGSVVDIRAKENQTVKKGDILAIIDNSRLETRKSQLESNIEQANLQLKQIQAQITSQDHRISAETDRLNRTIASAEAELSRRRREYQDRLITTSAEVTESEANLKSIQAALNAAISKRNRYQIVANAGALSKNQLEEAQVAVEQQVQAVQAAQARLQTVQTALNPSNAEVAKARENIAQEKASGQSNLANLQQEKEALIQQQIEIQQQQSRDQHELQQIEKDLDQTAIKATADGILFQLNLRNTGQRVVSGEEIAQIAPSNTPLLVKASVSAQNITQVKPGQLAQLRVSACPYPDYGIIQGVVNKISPDTIQFPGQNNTAVAATTPTKIQPGETALYQVTIEPESLTLGHGNNRCSLQLGMEGRVDIIANEETVLKFLLRKARLLTDL
ncbi:MAG: hypothetical protein Kow0049_26140 [Stanieria sp.]